MYKKGKVIIISSVSGGGKTTVIRLLKKKFPCLFVAITATTRPPRANEVDGKDYYFFSKADFLKKIEHDDLLEHAVVHNQYYGIPAAPIFERLEKNGIIILNIDVQGMQTIQQKLGKEQTVSIFLLPPNKEIWEERLRNRNTDTVEQIRERVRQGESEIQEAKNYDYQIANEDLNDTMNSIIDCLKQSGVDLGKMNTTKYAN